MTLKNKYLHRSHISEKKFREIVRYFSEDLDAQQKLPRLHTYNEKRSINFLEK